MSALGIYLAVSLIFIIGTLIEFAIVMTIRRTNDLKPQTMVKPCNQLKLGKRLRKLSVGKESMLAADLKTNPIYQSRGAKVVSIAVELMYPKLTPLISSHLYYSSVSILHLHSFMLFTICLNIVRMYAWF